MKMIEALRLFFHPLTADDSELRERERAAEHASDQSFKAMQRSRLDYDTRRRTLDDVLSKIDEDDHAMKEALGG